MKDGRSCIVARFAVNLPRHPKFLGIRSESRGTCLGVFVAAVMYSRQEEQDGFCPMGALDGIATTESLSQLVDVGLLRHMTKDGIPGFDIHNYSMFNETRADIEARLTRDRVRKDSTRNPTGKSAMSAGHPGNGNGNVGSIKRGSARGTRVPPSDASPEDVAGWRERVGIPGDQPAEFDRFIDYWRSVPGHKGVKVDWLATWRNNLRNQKKYQASRPGTQVQLVPTGGPIYKIDPVLS